MRLTRLLGAALGTSLLFLAVSGSANAYDRWRDRDRDHWRHDHWSHERSRHEHWGHDHWRHERPVVVRERPVVVRERPVVVERPMMMAPQPMYMAPMMPMQQGPSGLNLNFNIPLN